MNKINTTCTCTMIESGMCSPFALRLTACRFVEHGRSSVPQGGDAEAPSSISMDLARHDASSGRLVRRSSSRARSSAHCHRPIAGMQNPGTCFQENFLVVAARVIARLGARGKVMRDQGTLSALDGEGWRRKPFAPASPSIVAVPAASRGLGV
jgi:hypothetical protein